MFKYGNHPPPAPHCHWCHSVTCVLLELSLFAHLQMHLFCLVFPTYVELFIALQLVVPSVVSALKLCLLYLKSD